MSKKENAEKKSKPRLSFDAFRLKVESGEYKNLETLTGGILGGHFYVAG